MAEKEYVVAWVADGIPEVRGNVVRCKDCKHWYPLTKTCNNVDGACCQSYVADDWFCADGERKDTK